MNPVAAIKNSDPRAFVKAYELLHGKLFFFFLKKTKDMETAKELTQRSFIKLWQSRESLSEEHSLDAQSFTIAGSVLVDFYRKESAERKKKEQFSLSKHFSDTYSNPGDQFETADYLDAAADTLSPVRKTVFLLKTINGFSNKEVAEELSISVKTVEDHYSKAIRQIRALNFISIACVLGTTIQY